jgi:protein TonB
MMSVPFEALLTDRARRQPRRRKLTLTLSVALHGALVVGGIVYSLWHVEELAPPPLSVALHLGAVPPPPPPPPPARRSTSSTKPKTKPDPKREPLVVPKDRVEPQSPPEPEPSDTDDSQEGVAGGVPGGVQGGVVGGVVGGTPAPPPPKDTGPKMLPPQVAQLLLLIDPNSPEYRVKLPPALERSRVKFAAKLLICVSAQGSVTSVKILEPADPAIDPQIPSVIGRWRYRPYTVDGHPLPFCYQVRYEVTSR